jgi:hypothetical protein
MPVKRREPVRNLPRRSSGANFAGLESHLSSVQGGSIWVELAQALDGILNVGLDVDGGVHDSVGTSAQDAGQAKGAGEEPP